MISNGPFSVGSRLTAHKRINIVRGMAYCRSTASTRHRSLRHRPSAQISHGVVCLKRSASKSPMSGVEQMAMIGQTIKKAIWE